MEKYLRALPVLTPESEQKRAMTHMYLDDTKHHEDTKRQATKEVESLQKITDVINNQMIHPLNCEEQELVKVSTDHKAEYADMAMAREEGCSKRNRQ